ncbi:MAG TPA: c-type cytochrome [Terracidiphilus sp.]|nr:c-type cytochrome [Terracidiphilus sp.]HUX43717.1 c-type cytochrome [Terracidiphilus sp.]
MTDLRRNQRFPIPLAAPFALLFIALSGCQTRLHPNTISIGTESSSLPGIAPSALANRGKLIFDETPKYTRAYVGNRLSCSDCHIQSGTADYSAPMIDMAGLFPMFNKRAGHVISLQNRIQECFSRSEAGRPLPVDSPEMRALVAYIDWLSTDQVKGKPYKYRGFVKLAPLTGNLVAGKTTYETQCAPCHGSNGAGAPPILPAVWGRNSFNDGAGMNDPAKMAAFLVRNMPQNHPGTLSPQQAYDVSVYIHSKPRPKFNQAYKCY